MSDKHTCCANRFNGYRRYICGKTAKAERDGKWYCGIHDPVRLKAIRDKTYARYRAESEAQDKAWRRQIAEAKACEGVETELLTRGLLKRLLEGAK
jgi:hypothetical protein